MDDHMPRAVHRRLLVRRRAFKCWDKHGHGDLTLQRAIEQSCDVYFYQLGIKIGLARLVAGGI